MADTCMVCGDAPVLARCRCNACYHYLRRTGYDLTVEEVERRRYRKQRKLVTA